MSLLANHNALNNIPLHCNVCPKNPDFSDVSHLLTHVASKGHLSAYYKMKVKGSSDNTAKQIIDDYDEWYEEFNLEELMRERMSQKERKKRGSGNASRRTSGTAATNSSRSTPAGSSHGPRMNRVRDNKQLLDPQLGSRLHLDSMSRQVTPQPFYTVDQAGFQRALVHGYANWHPSGTPSFEDSPYIKQESFDSSASDDDDDYDAHDYPPARKPRRGRQNASISAGSLDELSIDDLANDSTKLKGIYWPGMDMFDSATPEARRKRNQKKAISVLQSLQATSEVVQPTECVFDTDGVLRKEREITGNPESEDSLIEGELEPEPDVPKKKRAPRRSRPALAEKNVNNSRIFRNRGQSHHPPFSHKIKKPSFKEEDDDDDLTYGPRPKKRFGLSIHRDNSGPEITFDQPAPMNYLTSGLRSPLQPTVGLSQQPYHNTGVPRAHARQPSWGQLNSGFRPTTSVPIQNFSNFGHYLTGNVGPANQPTFHNQLGFGTINNNQAVFQPQIGGTWDFLGLENDGFDILPNNGNPFHFNGDMTATNPLFLPHMKEDDEATISAADEEH